jgi:hypothetical protein
MEQFYQFFIVLNSPSFRKMLGRNVVSQIPMVITPYLANGTLIFHFREGGYLCGSDPTCFLNRNVFNGAYSAEIYCPFDSQIDVLRVPMNYYRTLYSYCFFILTAHALSPKG